MFGTILAAIKQTIIGRVAGGRSFSTVLQTRLLLVLLAVPVLFFVSLGTARTAGWQLGKSRASPSAVLPPTISLSFDPPTVRPPQRSTVTITVTNPNPSTALTGVSVTYNFPAGLTSQNLIGSCPEGLGGLTVIGLLGSTLPPGTTCFESAILDTLNASPGVITSSTSGITSDNGGPGGHASATFTILPPLPPSVSASFSPSTIAVNQTSTYSMVLTNPNANVTLTGVNISDDMPAGVTLGNVQSTDCGGTINKSANSFVISAVTLSGNSTCTVTATVTGTTTGTKNTTTSFVNAGNAGNGNQATATLTVSCINAFIVNDTGDTVDTTPGGSCPPNGGVCTLRGAIQAIQAETGCSGTADINFNVSGTISLASSLPIITRPINFNGPGAQLLTIAGNNSFQLVNILLSSNGTMNINDLSFTGGRRTAGVNAAALEFNNNGTLNVIRCEFFGNSGPSAGAADASSVIFSNASAALNLTGTTIRNNQVEHVVEVGNTPFNITNSTISNNTGTGAGVFIFGGVSSANITNSTIANNNQGIWHANTAGTSVVTIKNTILSQNGNINVRRTPGPCPATTNRITSAGNNLIDDNSGPANLCTMGPGDLSGTSVVAGIAPLGNYGGTTQTRKLLPNSQALNAGGAAGAPTTDQRGVPRPFGGAFDIGAVEMGPVVNSTGDGADVTPGNGICETATGNGICTLRAAIQEGQALGGNNIIQFNVPTPATISLASALPDITIPTSIFGPGANLLTISGNNTFRLMNVLLSTSGATSIVNINDLSFTGGRRVAPGNAAALEFNNNGTLNVNRCEFFGNSGASAGAADGSSLIFSNASTAINLNGATIRNNQVEHVFEIGNTPFNITNSTISNNTGTGAGVFIFGGVPSATITNSTIANNNQGIWHNNGGVTSVVTIKNTLLSQNGNVNLRRTPGDCPASTNQIVSAGHNLIDDNTGPINLCTMGPGDLAGTSVVAGLAASGNYGGTTQTRALIRNSSQAIDSGDNNGSPTTDQRGVARPSNGTVDIGAYEASVDTTPTSLPSGSLNVPYASTTLAGTGGTGPYTIAIKTGTLPNGITLSSGGVLSGIPTQSGSFPLTVNATDGTGIKGVRNYGLTINANSAPSIIAGGTFTRSQGSNAFDTIATVSDAQDAAGSLTVTATTVPAGITVSNISNTNGSILARIRASCAATLGDNIVTLTVTDSGNMTATANITVTVSADTPPSFAYQNNYTVASGGTIDIFPPTNDDDGTIVSTVIQSHGTYTGTIMADPSTGFIRLLNAAPAGVHTFTVRATDNCGLFTDASFTVTVTNPVPQIINYSPGSAPQNSSGTVVTIDGSNFTQDSVVLYNGASHATTFLSNTQLSFTLTTADTATVGTFIVAVMNPSPGGGTTDPVLFTIDPPNVCGSQTADIPTLQFAHVMVFPGVCSLAGVEASMFHHENPGNTVSRLYVATYTGNPTGTSILDVGGGFMDLQDTNPGPIDVINAAFYYPASITGATETNLKPFFFTGDHWQAVKSSGGSDPILNTNDNLNGTVSGGMFSVGFDDTSTPKISELTSTVFTFSTAATPTAVDFDSAIVTQIGNSAMIEWKTGMEVNNLGFNVYRQSGSERVQINPSLIAGTALMVGSNVRVESGYTYTWTDETTDSNASYWIEDVDLDGTTTWHGPFGITGQSSTSAKAKSVLLTNLNANTGGNLTVREAAADSREWAVTEGAPSTLAVGSQPVTKGRTPTPTSVPASLQKQWEIASRFAVKIAINKTGWYKVNAADLAAAGLNLNAMPAGLRMYVGGVEVPIKVNSADGLHVDSVEFYGAALNTATSDTQVYWLTSGPGNGKRINVQQSPGSANSNVASSFQYTVERKDRSLYFSSLRNGDTENWFGPMIATSPVSLNINVHNHDANAVGQAQIEVALQGVTLGAHRVNVMLNDQAINTMTFDGMEHPVMKVSIPESSLIEGNNQITLVAQNSGDVSLIDYVRITYAHTYTAENNTLSAMISGMPIKVSGFTSDQIRAIDVSVPNQPVEVEGTIDGDSGNYSLCLGPAKRRNLIFLTHDRTLRPLSITANQPSNLSNAHNGADFVIITDKDFASSVQPLLTLRESQGYQVSIVDVDSIYDQFSYGVHSPYAVRDFLNWTYTHWQRQPRFVMLAGSGTLDPRNYTGVGFMDFVPTKLIDTSSMETASDDWFVDFNNDGKPQMSIGRLPVRNAVEATLVINKIIAYEHSDKAEAMVLVSDISDNADFNGANNQIKSLIPSSLSVVNITRGQTNGDAKTALLDQLNQGGRIVNYAGHGSVNLWRGGLLTNDDMSSLANHKISPLIVTMTCLNGYFQDPKLASLGESLLKVNQGGAVSVWASSGMTDASNQNALSQQFFQRLFSNPSITIGEAVKAAKNATNDNDIRRTWILFGDPTMRIKN